MRLGRTNWGRDDLRGYAICTEPRSGSNFLCEVLASTGVLGNPTEYFNGPTRRRRGMADYPDDPRAQLLKVISLGATPNGVYGLKIFEYQFDLVQKTRWAERLPSLAFVSLTRHDVLGQAISQVRAMQTSQWITGDAPQGRSTYDFRRINAELIRLLNARTRWSYFLSRSGAPILHLAYEDIVRAPQATAEAVGRLVDLDEQPVVDMTRVDTHVQRDELSEEWRARFIAKARSLRRFPAVQTRI